MSLFRTARKERALLRRVWQAQRPWILLAALSLIILFTGQELVYGHFDLRQAFVDYYTNLSAELLSIALTLSVITALSRQYARRERDAEREKLRLLKNLSSGSSDEKRETVRRLRETDYLVDGTLHNLPVPGADWRELDFSYADMEGINLSNARLQNAKLIGADLQGANLSKALLRFTRLNNTRLIEANLTSADLQQADLSNADLRYTEFANADLRGAILDAADLRGANLRGANLTNACIVLEHNGTPFSEAKFDGATILPDGSNWVLGCDPRRFTDGDHAEFWTPEGTGEQRA